MSNKWDKQSLNKAKNVLASCTDYGVALEALSNELSFEFTQEAFAARV